MRSLKTVAYCKNYCLFYLNERIQTFANILLNEYFVLNLHRETKYLKDMRDIYSLRIFPCANVHIFAFLHFAERSFFREIGMCIYCAETVAYRENYYFFYLKRKNTNLNKCVTRIPNEYFLLDKCLFSYYIFNFEHLSGRLKQKSRNV